MPLDACSSSERVLNALLATAKKRKRRETNEKRSFVRPYSLARALPFALTPHALPAALCVGVQFECVEAWVRYSLDRSDALGSDTAARLLGYCTSSAHSDPVRARACPQRRLLTDGCGRCGSRRKCAQLRRMPPQRLSCGWRHRHAARGRVVKRWSPRACDALNPIGIFHRLRQTRRRVLPALRRATATRPCSHLPTSGPQRELHHSARVRVHQKG